MASRFLLACTLALGCAAPFLACGSEEPGDDGSPASSASSGSGGATSSSSAASSSMSASSTGGGTPVTCPASSDDYSTLGMGTCDLLAQDCANPAEACEPASVNGVFKPKCVEGDGLKGVKTPCSASSECQGGLYCVFGMCSPVCCPETNAPCEGGSCNVEFSGDTNNYGAGNYILLCSFLVQCQLLVADACAAGTECHVQDAGTGLALCVPPNGANVPEGGACNYVNDCGDMQECYGGACRYYCRVSDGGTGTPGLGGCPSGQACLAVDYGVEDVGICQPE
jgi:hypothetical protein